MVVVVVVVVLIIGVVVFFVTKKKPAATASPDADAPFETEQDGVRPYTPWEIY